MKTALLACVLVAAALLSQGQWIIALALFTAPLIALGALVALAMVLGDRPEPAQ